MLKYNLRRGGEDPNDRKKKMPKKTCHDGDTGRYGAPKSGIKHIGQVVRIAFNDRSKQFEFEVEHYLEGDDEEQVHLFWLTWAEMTTYYQYQVALWFYLRNDIPNGMTFETQVPSSTAIRALEAEEETEDE
jgi:hypothetical protein